MYFAHAGHEHVTTNSDNPAIPITIAVAIVIVAAVLLFAASPRRK